MSTSLPLPRGFFDTNVRLSDDTRRQYIEYAESSIRNVFALSDTHKNSWIPVREKKGVNVFRNFSHSRGGSMAAGSGAHRSNVAEVGCKVSMHASLDEIGRAYAAHDDALFKRLMKKLIPGVMDAAVLFTIVPRTPHTPFRYIGIKWYAVKTPNPLVSHRDFCCLEVQDKITDSYGNEMYIRIMNSIEINECPSLENSHALIRAKLLSGYMYRTDRAEPNLVRVHHVARFDPSGYFPSQWAYKTAESQLISSVVQIRRIIDKQQMNACTFVDKKQWVPNHARQDCAVCSRSFGTFRPRHHCRCCGEVICGKCSIFKSVDVPGTTIKNVRICSICNMGVQKAAGMQDVDTMSDISTSSHTSSSTVAHNEMNMADLYLSASNPGTPSAYSDASSTNSNLSFRSTASSRSVVDARGRGFSSQSSNGLYRTGSQRGGFFGSSQTPVHYRNNRTPSSLFNDTNTPRSYIANNLTPRDVMGIGFGGNVTPNSESGYGNGFHTPSAATQRMSIFKQNPLDLGYLRDSISSNVGIAASSRHDRSESSAQDLPPAKKVARGDGDAEMLESSAVSTSSPMSSNNSAHHFADEKEPAASAAAPPQYFHLSDVHRNRAMTQQPRVLSVCSERDSSSVGLRQSTSTMRVSNQKKDGDEAATTNSNVKKPFFSGLFARGLGLTGDSSRKAS
ncbi:1-phosphatidylinositol 3-phosphate 5-kinase, partial [Globisporangium splendens]